MFPLIPLIATLIATLSVTHGADPDPPRPRTARPLSATQDCNGPVAFSSSGGIQHPSKVVAYHSTLAETGVGWNRETGEFTVHCPGLYQLSFSGMTEPTGKLVLKKHSATSNSSTWTPIVATPKGGGSNLVLQTLVVGDQLAVWTEGVGALLTTQDTDVHVTSFSGFRISTNPKNELKS